MSLFAKRGSLNRGGASKIDVTSPTVDETIQVQGDGPDFKIQVVAARYDLAVEKLDIKMETTSGTVIDASPVEKAKPIAGTMDGLFVYEINVGTSTVSVPPAPAVGQLPVGNNRKLTVSACFGDRVLEIICVNFSAIRTIVPTIKTTNAGKPQIIPAGTALTFETEQAIDGHDGFKVTVDGVLNPVSTVTGDGSSSYTLTLGSTIVSGKTVRLSYIPGNVMSHTVPPVELPAFADAEVYNGSTQSATSTPPTITSARIAGDGETMVVTFSRPTIGHAIGNTGFSLQEQSTSRAPVNIPIESFLLGDPDNDYIFKLTNPIPGNVSEIKLIYSGTAVSSHETPPVPLAATGASPFPLTSNISTIVPTFISAKLELQNVNSQMTQVFTLVSSMPISGSMGLGYILGSATTATPLDHLSSTGGLIHTFTIPTTATTLPASGDSVTLAYTPTASPIVSLVGAKDLQLTLTTITNLLCPICP